MIQRPHHRWTYDVFLNFRGSDTRTGFIGNLYHALRQRGINTFIDAQGLQRGEEITPSLSKAIKESQIAIVVFSENYASSAYCLDELVLILQCLKEEVQSVLPIFYDVEPSQVRHQNGSYGEALAKHEKKYSKVKLEEWKSALSKAANLSGWPFKPGNEYEYEFIGRIIKEVYGKINQTLLHVIDYPVGLDSRVVKLKLLLDVGSMNRVSMVGIHGIGGIGKTTIARAVYNLIGDQFEGVCFLNVRTISDKHGLLHLQETVLFELVGEKHIKLGDINKGVSIIRHRLHQKKVLLVLDDVDQLRQLQALAGGYDWFGSGSRIIITTRDKHLLARHGVERMYEVQKLNDKEALQLFSWNAFREEQVHSSYLEISERTVSYCSGLPLALEVIGFNFCGKGIDEWNSALEGYERAPDRKIFTVLKLSYDTLEDIQKEIFLVVACFFKGELLEDVKDMLRNVRGITSEYAIGVLIDRSLIKIEYGHLTMHDLVQDMGKEIIQQASPNEPGGRSRLWFHEDILRVLQENTITMVPKINTIADINDTKDTWKLAVRITGLWHVRIQQRPEWIEMILMDEKGYKIEANVKYDLDKRKKELKQGNTYILQNFDVQINDGHYRKCDHQFKLMFMKGTIVAEHDLIEIPPDSYIFKNFGDLLSGNLNSDFLIDVIGVFYKLIDYQPDKKPKKVMFAMKDHSGNILNTTLWEEYASKFESFHGSHKAGPMVIILTLAKIKESEGNYPISIQNSKHGSKLLINEDIAEIQQFRNSLEASELNESCSQMLSQMSPCSQFSSQDKFFYRADVISISKVNDIMQECICVTVGTIEKLFANNGWIYDGCSQCTKKATSDKAFTCACGKYNEKPVPRYRLEFKVCHKNDHAKFVMWDRECFQVIGQKAVDLLDLMIAEGEFNSAAFPVAIDDILGLTLAFRIKVQPSYNRSSVQMVSQDSQLIELLIEAIENQFPPAEHSLSGTADHDPDLLGCITPAKRMSPGMHFEDLPAKDLASTQLSSTKLAKRIKRE